MKRLPLIFVLLLAPILSVAAPDVPIAIAKFCGNTVIHAKQKPEMFAYIQSQGCDKVEFVHIEGQFYLAFGTKILVAEAVSEGF